MCSKKKQGNRNNSDTFDISSVGKGIYLLTVETQNDTKTSKIIKK